ncbi:right-handed parallel beta-helix repeat-containing protein [Humibacillus xanthopallidus]|uniref:right-handed parallel beta-helix repeat-containing protein n=1 Tax=Humibacillus xanthopallidus TaxID=412689 RepID=UPI00384FDC6E
MSGRHEVPRGTKGTSSERDLLGWGRKRRWTLTVGVGGALAIAASLLVAPLASYASEVFSVNATTDLVDADVGDGLCLSAAGTCTLRAAVQEANATPVPDTITVPAGIYQLTIPPGGSNEDDSGDLDLTAPVTIAGAGAAATVIDGGPTPADAPPEQTGMDRLVEITDTAGAVTLTGLTLSDGWSAEDGGALYNLSAATVSLRDVTVSGSESEAEGGGIHHVHGTLLLTDSTLTDNHGRGGGGLYVAGAINPNGLEARAVLTRVTLSSNGADTGGGVSIEGGSTTEVRDSTFTANEAGAHGAGLSATSKSRLTVVGGRFADNRTSGDGGGAYTATEAGVSFTGTLFIGNVAGAEIEGEIPSGSGGGLAASGMGVLTVDAARFEANTATEEGGGLLLGNQGAIEITDTMVTGNEAGAGGGIENAGSRVTLRDVTVTANEAEHDGGGIESNGSGDFTIIDTTISANTAENGGGLANAADGALRVEKSLIWDNRALARFNDDTGLGGGVYSLGDAEALYENVTITGNIAQVRGGGIYVDADAPVHVSSSTIAHNTAPIASGVGGEIGSPNVPIQPSAGVVLRNTIVADNQLGPNCSFAVGSQGGNLEDGDSCWFRGDRDRQNATTAGLDAVADNGGATMTMALVPQSLAVDNGVSPCPTTDQRGIARPKNVGCDSGAFEFEGPFGPPDTTPPDTSYVSGPVQDTLSTSLFRFTGTDDLTATADLRYECRLIETDPTEPPEPPDPTAPLPPELRFVGCAQPWQVPLIEDGFWTFEVRAIDRAGNVDPTPDVHQFDGIEDLVPPDTQLVEKPADPSSSGAATFSFTATDERTPLEFMTYECRLDTLDPELWLECTNPATYGNLPPGEHTFQVRAVDAADNIDPSPASWTWTVGTAVDCDAANITMPVTTDATVDEANPLENVGALESLIVRSAAPGADARSLVRLTLPTSLPPCELESATLRLYGEGDDGRTLEATPAGAAWQESSVIWNNQPEPSTAAPAEASSGSGYREFDVRAHVEAFLAGEPNHGWIIRDAAEEDAAGAQQSFVSSEAITDPPTPPQLVLRFQPSGTPAPPAPPAPSGPPTTVVCGQVITESTLVGNDLTGCLGEGLVIGAPDLVLDLGGHTISSGLVLDPGAEEGFYAGVRNSGHTNVVVRNGTISGFGYGVRLTSGVTHNLVTGLTLRTNTSAGVELFDADNGRIGNTVRGNTFVLNGDGITLLGGAEGSTVADNTFSGNLGRALYAFDASGHVIDGNVVSGDTLDPTLDSDGGFHLEASTDNRFTDNTLSDVGDAAFLIAAGSHRTLIEGNTTTRSSDSAVNVDDSDGVRVIANTFHQAGGAAISLGNSDHGVVRDNDVRFNPGGVELSGSDDTLVESNDARRTQADGISLESSARNTVTGNQVSHTGGTGISVEGEVLDADGNPVDGNTISANDATGNLGDGIAVNGAGHIVTGNEAYNNGAWGISAAAGTTDGGGNLASGNAEPEQCRGVVCAAGTAPPVVPPDTTAPDTTITAGPANGSPSLGRHTFSFTGSDDQTPPTALRFECRVDAPPDPEPEPPEPPDPGDPVEPAQPVDVENWNACGSPMTYELLLSGEHTFEVRAIDPADNVDLTPAVFMWTVVSTPPGPDGIAPTTTISSAPTDPSTSTTATIAFRGSDNATPGPYLTFECSLDGGAYAACTSPEELAGLTLGEHTFAVRAIDVAGNRDASPATHTWTIEAPPADTIAPETTITEQPDATTVDTAATFAFTSNEPEATFECQLGSAAYTACTSPHTVTVGVGTHTFSVRAVDAADNVDPTPASVTWQVGPAPVPTAATCGQVVTQSIILTQDLLDCGGDGLVAGAGSITIDLGGHLVDGTGLAIGIRVDGHDAVTVRNGVVQQFDNGVAVAAGSARGIVTGLELRLNELAGIALSNADDATGGTTVRDNTSTGNGIGIQLDTGTERSHVLRNTISGNSGQGIYLLGSGANTIEGNTIVGSSDVGLQVEGSSGNRLLDNTVSLAADVAILVTNGSHDTRVEGNELTDSEGGIHVDLSNGSQILGNTVHGSSDGAVAFEAVNGSLVRGNDLRFNAVGIEIDASTGNRFESNDASDSTGSGIEVGDGSQRNVFLGNIANANGGAGIEVGASVPAGEGNLLLANTTNANTTDGLSVIGLGHMIRDNQADNNGGWGIYSSLGTLAGMNVDGGGNRAAGNSGGAIDPETGDVIQCHNVVCDGGPGLPADLVPPDTSIVSGPTATTTRTTATIAFTGADNATPVTFTCRVDSTDAAAFAPCSSPVSLTGLSLGSHTFEVRATDWSGNVDATPATVTWNVTPPAPDAAPETEILSAPDATTVATGATFTFTSDEEMVTFTCTLDGTAAPCTSPTSYSGLGVGPHTFTVAATDGDGLTDPTPAAHAWAVTSAPVPTAASCGQTITTSVVLTGDLTDCSGDGLVVGAGGITIDLGGHTVDGIGLGAGVRNNGFASVAITGGTVREFDDGVLLSTGSSGIVDEMVLADNQVTGVALRGALAGTIVRHTSVTTSPVGIELSGGTTGAVLRDNEIGSIAGDGIMLDSANANTVTDNTVTGSSQSAVGLTASDGNVISGNTATANSGSGVSLDLGSDDNTVRSNTIDASGSDGISVTASTGNDLAANTVTTSGGCGISLDDADGSSVTSNDLRFNAAGICLTQSSDNVIEGNTVTGSSGSGITLEAESFGNLVASNTISGSSGSGIEVAGSAPAGEGNLIRGNTVTGNAGDGIAVADPGHTVTGNTATLNDGWGILAVSGTTDGGANAASGNAEPGQCLGVVCDISAAIGAPETTIVDRPSDPSNSANALFTFTGSDNTTPAAALAFQCRLDSTDEADFVDCDNPWQLTGLTPGEHVFEVRAIDETGLVDASPASFTWTYAALPPDVAPDTFIGIKPPLASPLLDVVFTFSSDEPDVTFECSLDGAAYSPCEFAFEHSFEETEVGQHTFRVRATDPEGNTDASPATWTWTVTGIVATVTDGPAFIPPEGTDPATGGETIDTNATFTFESNVADSTFRCAIDSEPFTTCDSGTVTYTGLAVGDRMFRVYAISPEGAEQIEVTVYEWVIVAGLDTVAPTTTITGGPADPTGAVTFSFTGADNVTSPQGLTFECSLNDPADAAFTACTSPWTYPNPDVPEPLTDGGSYTFYVRAIDVEDNVDATPASHTFTYAADTIAPSVTVAAVPAITTNPVVRVSFSTNDPFAVTECALDGVTFEPCASPHEATADVVGPHTLTVRATDLAGNVGSAQVTWTLQGPPETTITSFPASPTADPTATFELASNVPGSTFECALDAGPFLPCPTPQSYADLADGDHTLLVRASVHGFVDATPAEHTWTVEGAPADTTPPETAILSGPQALTTATTAAVTFESTDPGAGFECSLDGVPFAPCTSPLALTGLAEGDHVLEVRAVDHTGNADPTPATRAWTVDGPPEATITAGPDDPTEMTTATFEFASDEADSTFACWLDGVTVACDSPKTYTGIGVGAHTFAVQATDAAGNVQPNWTEWEWTVVTAVAPTTTLTSAPTGSTTSTTATFAFATNEPGTFECSVDAAAYAACTSPLTLTGLAAGDHTFAVRAIDLAGNRDASPATASWTITTPDTTPPSTTGTAGPSGTTTSTTATFEFASSEPGSTFECALDAAAYSSCTSPVTLNALSAGSHTFSVRATDGAGNTDASPHTWSWTVEAAPAVCTAPTTTLTANADSWLDQGSPSSNKGTDSVLKVMSKSGGNLRAVVRFPAPTVPSACAVGSATLRLNATSSRTGRTLQALPVTGAWNENAVTWANQPATGGPAATTTSGNGWRQWTVTDQVRTMVSAAGAPSFLVRDASEGNDHEQQFRSRESNSDRPSLVITWVTAGSTSTTPTPPPPGPTAPDCGPVLTLAANRDTWVDQSSPSQNKGGDSSLKVRSKSGQALRTLVGFTLPPTPTGCVVDEATLRLEAGSAAGGRTLQAFSAAAAWTEGGATWSNQPATTGTAATTTSGTGWRQWAVTSQVRTMYGSGQSNGFVIRDSAEGGNAEQSFHSREDGADRAPQLVVRFAPAP